MIYFHGDLSFNAIELLPDDVFAGRFNLLDLLEKKYIPFTMLDNNAFNCVDSICVLYFDNDFLFILIELFNFLSN